MKALSDAIKQPLKVYVEGQANSIEINLDKFHTAPIEIARGMLFTCDSILILVCVCLCVCVCVCVFVCVFVR